MISKRLITVLPNLYCGDCCCHCYIGYISSYIALKSKNDSRLNGGLQKRVSITPETAKNLIDLIEGMCEKNYANHLGVTDNEYKKVGVELKILLMKF